MKKFITLSLLLTPCFAFAQFSKGQIYLGGTFSTSIMSSTAQVTPGGNSVPKSSSFSISPVFGVFLNPKIVMGGSVGYTYSSQEFDYLTFDSNTGTEVNGFQKSKSNAVNVSWFTRYYVPISNSFYFALQDQINFSRANSETDYGVGSQVTTQQTPNYSIGVTMKPVLIFFPSPKWGIEASVGSLGYVYTKYLPDAYSTNTFSLSGGSFSFGLAYYFPKK